MKQQANLKRAVAYARFSSDLQREESIDAQLRAIRDYAAKNDMVIVGEYVDRAKSATNDQRPEFQRMIKDAAGKGFEFIIVHKLDRFSRNRYNSAHYKYQLRRYGVSLRSVTENIDGSPESIIMESVLEGMAEFYSHNLAREVRKGLTENALKGMHTGGVPPFGYDVDPVTKMLVINEREAEGVKLIFSRVLEGVGYDTIINELNALGFRGKRGQVFSKPSLNSILKNPKYTGDYYFNRSRAKDFDGKRSGYKDESEFIIAEGAVPQIISKEDFGRVKTKLQARMQTRRHSRAKEVYLLTGKMVCGVCGGSYVGSRRQRGSKSMFVAYGCNKRYRAGDTGCKNKEISKPYIESWIVERLAEYVFSSHYIPKITREYNSYIQRRNHGYNAKYDMYVSNLKALDKDIDRVVSLLLNSNSNALTSKLQELEADKVRVEYLLQELERDNRRQEYGEQDISAVFAHIRKSINEGTLENIRGIIDTFVSRIVVNPDCVIVHYNFFPDFTMRVDEKNEKDCPDDEGCDPHEQSDSEFSGTLASADEMYGEGGI